MRDLEEAGGPRVVERTGRDVHVVFHEADLLQQRQDRGRIKRRTHGAFRAAGRAGGVEHRSPVLGGHRRRFRVAGLRRERVAVDHAGRRRAAVDHDVPHPRDLRADARERLGVFGIRVDQHRVGVVHDVGRLLGREAIVQRHRDRTDLRARIPAHHDAGGVRPAPHEALAGFEAELAKHVREAVGPAIQLGERPRRHGAVRPIVDDRRLVCEAFRLDGERIDHAAVAPGRPRWKGSSINGWRPLVVTGSQP